MKIAGCTFFALILKAIKDGYSRKDSHGSCAIKEPDVLKRLIRVFYPEYPEHDPNTQGFYTTQFKNGENVDGDVLPFSNMAFIDGFDRLVTDNHAEALKRMYEFTNTTLNVESESVCIWLVSALYELLNSDDSTDKALFYVSCDGTPLPKQSVLEQKQVCLPAFLLGIWHFIVCHRPDNTIGKETISAWYKKASPNGKSKKIFNSAIGTSSKFGIKNVYTELILNKATDSENKCSNGENGISQSEDCVLDSSNFLIPSDDDSGNNNSDFDDGNEFIKHRSSKQIFKNNKVTNEYANQIFNIDYIENFNA